ncbi:MAG: 50S ribosomal protein L6 [Candidatus Thermoplasmatota archaeon]|jgi:large subunit ribosomal protein L6|nr:50S ribosomal protein L6 [Candidatus Thermoplasmatota archaeon]MCL5790229.1 50S ribosomal protein L6 [Candidatus Thermoplasmatota archaeon]
MERTIEIPQGIVVKLNGFDFEAQGPKGKVKKTFRNEYVAMEMKEKEIRIYTKREKKTDLAVVGTWESIVNSAFVGVTKGFIYTMKIVYAHFPVKVTVKGNEVHLDNFLGEKSARKITLEPDTKVTVKGDIVTVEGSDLEATGNAAARIEKMSKIKGFDPRVFQDGIYIVRKGDVIEG